jgi:hypothetical protein
MRALVLLGLSAAVIYGVLLTLAFLMPSCWRSQPFRRLSDDWAAGFDGNHPHLAGFGGFHHMLVLMAFLAVYRIIQDYVISPHLMSTGMEFIRCW